MKIEMLYGFFSFYKIVHFCSISYVIESREKKKTLFVTILFFYLFTIFEYTITKFIKNHFILCFYLMHI